MNKDYMYLSDDEMIISDENGNMEIVPVLSRDIDKTLMLENSLEIIEDKIADINRKIIHEKGQKDYRLMQLKILVSAGIVGLIAAPILYTDLGIPQLTLAALIPLESCLIAPLSISSYLKARNFTKQINGYSSELDKAEQLRKEFEKELSTVKAKVVAKDYKKTNEIFHARKYENYIQKELETSYSDGYSEKPKTMVLRSKIRRNK